MEEIELSSKKHTVLKDNSRLRELETWFKTEYIRRSFDIQRDIYLGLKPRGSRYLLELEAYKKENEIRAIKGLPPLETIKIKDLL